MTRARATATRSAAVSRPHDAAERQADRAAETVARGGSVAGWSFGSVAATAEVHRQEAKGPSNEEKLKKAAAKAGEAALETKAGKRLIEAVKQDPLVRKATDFLDTTAGKVVAGGVIAAGVGGLAAAEQPLPFQAPEIPLDAITPGLSGKITIEGPLNAPTYAGISLTFREQGPKESKGPGKREAIAAETARLRRMNEMFKPESVKAQEAAAEQAAIAAFLDAEARRWRRTTLIPLIPGAAPKTVDAPEPARQQEPKPEKDEDRTKVQRAPASMTDTDTGLDSSGVEPAISDTGRALDPAIRRSMEARFGYDFADVRIHDSSTGATAAQGLRASAFTVGEDIVFDAGRFDPDTPQGRHLLAHELAHVVQQRHAGGDGHRIRRRGVFETIGIWLGLVEGSFSDTELRAYLDQLTKTGTISKAYDADNKARAIVRLWKAGTAGWDLVGRQKSLLIDEMLDGPTLNDDERSILDLLQGSDASDLRQIFADPAVRMQRLDRDFHGAEHDQLSEFVAGRFKGGRAALLAGKDPEVLGDPVPPTAPRHGFDPATFDVRLDSDRTHQELIAIIDTLSSEDRGKVLQHLMHTVWPTAKKDRAAAAMADRDGLTPDQVYELDMKEWTAGERISKTERILQHYFLSEVPATKEALTSQTEPIDPALADQMRNVLLPKQYTAEAKEEAAGTKDETEDAAKDAGAPTPEKIPERAKFHDPTKYQAEIEAAVPGVIQDNYDLMVTAKGPRATHEEIEAISEPAKDETDAVFGAFYDESKHPKLRFPSKGKPGNLSSWYDVADREMKAMSTGQKRRQAIDWLKYYLTTEDDIRTINDKYSASPTWKPKRNDEARILDAIARKACRDPKTVQKLLETRRAWGGMAAGSQVMVDLYHSPDVEQDRRDRWEMFQTLVHEYIHTLSHKQYDKYAKSFGVDTAEWNTLIEGVDNVLEEMVWARVEPRTSDKELREAVEGPEHAKLPPLEITPPSRYPSYEEAFRLTTLVGIKNVMAAYFLGLVDRISVPKGKRK